MATNNDLSTHVLDTALGRPAAGLSFDIYRLNDGAQEHLGHFETNADGRTEGPIVPSDNFAVGVYELVFHAGPYLDRVHGARGAPRFLDDITLRFGVDDPTVHYHVPLLLSPHGYTTYRGS